MLQQGTQRMDGAQAPAPSTVQDAKEKHPAAGKARRVGPHKGKGGDQTKTQSLLPLS